MTCIVVIQLAIPTKSWIRLEEMSMNYPRTSASGMMLSNEKFVIWAANQFGIAYLSERCPNMLRVFGRDALPMCLRPRWPLVHPENRISDDGNSLLSIAITAGKGLC